MVTFVLVHGSWHDGAVWSDVITHLEQMGHRAFGPTLAGHGNKVLREVSHEDCVDSVVDFIESNDLWDFVLLGHSFGGTVIARVAQRLPDRIRRLVFWNAFVPHDGNCLLDEVPPHYRELFYELAESSDDNTVTLPFNVWRECFINDADMHTARKTYDLLFPEPFQPFLDKLDLEEFYRLEIPRSYINCTEDIALPAGEWGWHPRMSGRLGVYRLVQMAGSHEVLFTNPEMLASKIVVAGRD